MGTSDMIQGIRLHRARSLLQDSRMNVEQVAVAVGTRTPPHSGDSCERRGRIAKPVPWFRECWNPVSHQTRDPNVLQAQKNPLSRAFLF